MFQVVHNHIHNSFMCKPWPSIGEDSNRFPWWISLKNDFFLSILSKNKKKNEV